MKKKFSFREFFPLLITIIMVSLMISCSEDEEKEDPPELPPMEALLMDFSNFNNPNDTLSHKKSIESYRNWGHSYFTVAIWSWIATVSVTVPVIAYAEAFNHTPVYLGDNSWEWSYTKNINLIEYSVRLVSKRISNEQFTLKMYVTKSGIGGYEDFLWFEGTVRYDRTSATWTLYENPADPNGLLSIEWEMDWEEETYMIKYTGIKPGAAEYGSYIQHGVTTDTDYNAYYIISGSMNTVEINWNTQNLSGRVKDPVKFGDNQWHCWDETLQDVICE